MARVKVIVPEQKLFVTDYLINVDHINYGGHVGNDRFLSIMHEVRLRWLNSKGYENEISIQEGFGLFVVDAACEFLGELFRGERVEVSLAAADIHKYGFDLVSEIVRNKRVVFKGKLGMLYVNLDKKKAATLPQSLIDLIN